MPIQNGMRFIETGEVPEKPEDLATEVTLDYVDFGFADPQNNWRILGFIQHAEEEFGNPKYFNNSDREVYMDWAFEDAKWQYGMLEIDEPDIRNAIADYLAEERLWNGGEYVHPFAFN